MFIQYASGNLSHNGMTKKNKEKMIIVLLLKVVKDFMKNEKVEINGLVQGLK